MSSTGPHQNLGALIAVEHGGHVQRVPAMLCELVGADQVPASGQLPERLGPVQRHGQVERGPQRRVQTVSRRSPAAPTSS